MSKKAKPQKMGLHDFLGPDAKNQLPSESSGLESQKGKGKGDRGGGYQNRDNPDGRAETGAWRGAGRGGGGDRGDRGGGGDRGDRPPRAEGGGDGAGDDEGRADRGDWFKKTDMRGADGGGGRDSGFGDRERGGGFGNRDRGDRGDRDRGDRGGDRGSFGDRGDRGSFGDRGGGFGDRGSRGGFGDGDRDGVRRQGTMERSDGDWRGGGGGGSNRVTDDTRDAPRERPKMNLKPKTVTRDSEENKDGQRDSGTKPSSANPFGSAKPVDTTKAWRSAVVDAEPAPAEKPKPPPRENAWRRNEDTPTPQKEEKVEAKPKEEEQEEVDDGWTTVKKPAKKPIAPTTNSAAPAPRAAPTRTAWGKEEKPVEERKPAWKDNAAAREDRPHSAIEEKSSAWGRPKNEEEARPARAEPRQERKEVPERLAPPAAGAGKYVSPSMRRKQEEEAQQKQEEEERTRNKPPPREEAWEDRRSKDRQNERPPRPVNEDRREERPTRPAFGGGSGGKYVPPSQRNRQQDADSAPQQRSSEVFESHEKKLEKEKKKFEEQKLRREEEEKRRIENDEAFRLEKEREIEERKQKKQGIVDYNAEMLQEFENEIEESDDAEAVEKIAAEVDSKLPEQELQSAAYIGKVFALILRQVRHTDEGTITDAVKRWKPLITRLIKLSSVHRFKLKSLFACQKIISAMHMPRLSPETALIEAFFDALYLTEIIEEEYFHMWANDQKDVTENKEKALFQLTPWLDWLKDAKIEGEESTDEEGSDAEGSDEETDEEDIEANIPKTRVKALPAHLRKPE